MPKKRNRRKPIPNETFQTVIQHLSHDGRGIARVNDKITFLFGGLPGETVEFKYSKQKGSYDEGVTQTILSNHSNDRMQPRCPHFAICGGCSLQHMQPTFQLQQKQQAFLELLKQQGLLPPSILLSPLTGLPWGYRRKARLSVKYVRKKDKVLVGFRERQSHHIAEIQSCQVLHPTIGLKLTEFSTMISQLSIREHIPQLEVAVDDQQTAIIIRHMMELPIADKEILSQFAAQHQFRLYLQPAGPESIQIFYPPSAASTLSYQLADFNIELQFQPWQFIQVNAAMNQLMIKQAIELLDLQATDRVLDLFAGIGNFSLPIATRCQHVVGVEGDISAVNQAKQNATLNQINNVDFYYADLFSPIDHYEWSKELFNKLLLDPPRAGAQEILTSKQFLTWQPERIVYISCNPATLARDSKILQNQGYQLHTAGMLDMFPHTQHSEVIALFLKH